MGRGKTPLLLALLLLLAPALAGGEYVAPSFNELRHRRNENKAVIGIIEKLTGQVYVVRGGRGGKVPASIGTRLFENDEVVTDDRGRLHVRYKDGTYVELGAGSRFNVERVRFKPRNTLPAHKASDTFDESVFRFVQGISRVTAPDVHVLEYFTLKSSNAIIRVTGPADFYLVQLEGDRDLTIRVARGKVELINAITNEALQVPEGTGAYLKVSGMVTHAGPFTSEQLNFLKSRSRI